MGDELVDKREDAWVAVGQLLEVSTPELNALRYALMLDLQLFQRDHGIERKGALAEPTAVDGYLDALHEACVWLTENGQDATSRRMHDALKGRAEGAPKRAVNSAVDALHDAAVRREQLTEQARAKALEEVAALRARADERWAKGNKAEATELHFVVSQVKKLGPCDP